MGVCFDSWEGEEKELLLINPVRPMCQKKRGGEEM